MLEGPENMAYKESLEELGLVWRREEWEWIW